MNRDQLLELKQQTYELWYHAKSKKEKKYHKKILNLIEYTLELKICINSISKIGVSHI
jgi:hypothetical protein